LKFEAGKEGKGGRAFMTLRRLPYKAPTTPSWRICSIANNKPHCYNRPTMLTQEDLQAIGGLIKTEAGALIKTEGERLDRKIEASLAFTKQAHAEIMEALFKSNKVNRQDIEVNGQEIKALEKRVDRLEEHAGLTKSS
jgi:hypothetical protein